MTLNGGATLNFSLGTTSNQLRVSGGTLAGLGSAGSVLVNLTDGGGFAPGTYTLLDYSGASVSNFDATSVSIGTGIAGYDYSFSIVGSQLELTATAIPEPGTCALVAGAAILVFALIRRRRLGAT